LTIFYRTARMVKKEILALRAEFLLLEPHAQFLLFPLRGYKFWARSKSPRRARRARSDLHDAANPGLARKASPPWAFIFRRFAAATNDAANPRCARKASPDRRKRRVFSRREKRHISCASGCIIGSASVTAKLAPASCHGMGVTYSDDVETFLRPRFSASAEFGSPVFANNHAVQDELISPGVPSHAAHFGLSRMPPRHT